jgi:hypothetical protein
VNVGSSSHPDNHLNAASSHTLVEISLVRGTPQVQVDIQGERRTLLVDTGSSVSLMQPGVTNSPLRPTNKEPISVTGDSLLVQGEQSISFSINDYKFRRVFLVCKLPTSADGLVGMDFLAHWSAKLDIGNKTLMLANHRDENFKTR